MIATLFNCADEPGVVPDGIPAKETPGIFGYVRAYLGVVEPQMRKALHIHMLVQLLGFAHPQDIFGTDVLADTFRRVWYFVASICFRSTEAFAGYLRDESATRALQLEPLLPLTKKQSGMIGEARVRESYKAQLHARGLHVAPSQSAGSTEVSYNPSAVHGDNPC